MATYFKDHIKARELLSEEDFKRVVDDSNRTRTGTFYSSLINSGFLPEETVVAEACEFFGLSKIENAFHTEIDFTVSLKVCSIENIINRKQFAITCDNELIYIIPNPELDNVRSQVMTALGYEPQYGLITNEQFEVFAQYQLKPRQNQIRSSDIAIKDNKPKQRGINLTELEATAAQKLLDSLIECAIERRASDLHIRAMGRDKNAKVLLRVDGVIQEYTEIQSNALENLRNLLKTKCRVGGEQPDAPVEGQIVVTYNGVDIDTRVNIVRSVAGYDFVLRFITSTVRSIPELGLSENNLALYRRLLNLTKGLVLVCGPTGSGKTTLLYAGMQEKLAENKVIFTMEDPVEITMPGIVQLEVKKEKGMTYQKRFPSSLRHDPDIILFGEIREIEVANNAIQASDTGHLVLSTLHANDAASAITRLINIGVDPYALGDILAGVVAQRLVRRICPDCKVEYDLPADHHWRKMYNLGSGPIRLAKGTGCAKCAGTGYYDRIAINEIILVTNEIRDAIQTRSPRSVVEGALKKSEFQSYIQDGIEKAKMGITTLDELTDFQNDILRSIQHG